LEACLEGIYLFSSADRCGFGLGVDGRDGGGVIDARLRIILPPDACCGREETDDRMERARRYTRRLGRMLACGDDGGLRPAL